MSKFNAKPFSKSTHHPRISDFVHVYSIGDTDRNGRVGDRLTGWPIRYITEPVANRGRVEVESRGAFR